MSQQGALAQLRVLVRQLLDSGLAAADPEACVDEGWRRFGLTHRLEGCGGVDLLGVGKASMAMAAAASRCLLRDGLLPERTLVVCPEGSRSQSALRNLETAQILEAEHPVPGPKGLSAAREVLRFVGESATADREALVVLLSGGASAMLPAPLEGIMIEHEQRLTSEMLRSGADIRELNTLRKRLSAIKGGRLAAASNYRKILVLVLSDVVGDDLSTVASGPFVADETELDRVIEIAERRLGDWAPKFLELVAACPPMPDRRAVCFDRVDHWIVGNGSQCLAAMVASAEGVRAPIADGVSTETLAALRVLDAGSAVIGEAREVAAEWVARAAVEASRMTPDEAFVLLGAGETTVTVHGDGRGGRNQELALAFAVEWQRQAPGDHLRFAFGAFGTDGVDGPTAAAGAIVDSGTLLRLGEAGVDPELELDRNNSHAALGSAQALIETGPTGTNVGDLIVLVVSAKSRC